MCQNVHPGARFERNHLETTLAGYREWVALPSLGIAPFPAKLDTGARTCALHAADIEAVDVDGVEHVRFRVVDDVEGAGGITVTLPLLDKRWVRDSGGHGSLRPVVPLQVAIGSWIVDVEATLSDRRGMRHRMLLGRQALRGLMAVDPAQSFVLGLPGLRLPRAP